MSNPQYVIQADTIHADVDKIPGNYIAVMGYDTGSAGIDWTADDWGRFPMASHVSVDQSSGLAQFAAGRADVGDVERGAATIDEFITAAHARKARGDFSTLYTSYANLPGYYHSVEVAGLGGGWVNYFVADYSMSLLTAISYLDSNAGAVGVQFASPSSNPGTILPGTTLTLKEANCDLSVKRASWMPAPGAAVIAWRE